MLLKIYLYFYVVGHEVVSPVFTQYCLERYFLLIVSCHCLFASVNCLSFNFVIFLMVSLCVNSCWE